MDQEQSEALKEVAHLGIRALWCRLTIAVLRKAFSEEVEKLDEALEKAGVRPPDRTPIYDAMRERREGIERGLFLPGAYERSRAVAREMGLLTQPQPEAPR